MIKQKPLKIQKPSGRKKGKHGVTIQVYKQSEKPMRSKSLTIHGGKWLTVDWVKGMLTYYFQAVSYAMNEGKKFDIIIKDKEKEVK